MHLRSRKPFVFGLALALSSVATNAIAAEEAEPHPYFSLDALERTSFGVNAMLSVGTGSFTDTSTTAFYGPENSTGDSDPKQFGGGMTVELQAGLLLGKSTTLGLSRTWQGLSAVSSITPPGSASGQQVVLGSGSDIGASSWLGFIRTQSTDQIAPFFEAALGAGNYKSRLQGENKINDITMGTFDTTREVSAFVLRAKAGLDVAPIPSLPNLSFGGHAAGELWTPTGLCRSSPGTAEICDETGFKSTPNVGWSVALGARFALPLSKNPVPPPPPKPEFVLVESELRIETSQSLDPEVTDTPRYRSELGSVKTVAIQAPSECASQTAANATGQAAATGTVVKTHCGVEMGEIERELTKQGFIVQSWSTLASMVQEQRLTPTQAAAKLGAQVLFQVNSLERVQGEPARGARWERRFYSSDDIATKGEPLELPESEQRMLRGMVSQREDGALTGLRLGAMLDVNAILVSSGQTIWFYRWQKLDTGDLSTSLKALATRLPPEPWRKVQPRQLPSVAADSYEARSWIERGEEHSGGGPANAQDATYFQLMREVVRDFVTRFTGNVPGN